MKMKKLGIIFLTVAVMLFMGCKPTVSPDDGNKEQTENGSGSGSQGGNTTDNKNPEPYSSRSANLDFIFSTNSVGKVTITMKRSEWNQMLKNYDYFYKNENCVKFTKFEYEKDGVKWDLDKGGGIRLRGNTSRFRPQGKDTPDDMTGHRQMNADWSSDYYNYASNCSDDDYRQSHFKVDFEEFLEGDDEQKLAGCMKGVALKRMDGSCTKEIFCYDLFHRYGIWTAPRASHTRVFFNFIEDDDSVTTVNYGVYEMFEEVNKQSLKARDKDENKASNAWKNSKGNLWKCAGGDLTDNPWYTTGCEQIEITEFDDEGNPISWVWDSPTYDLKTNKNDAGLASASKEIRGFVQELNSLPDVINEKDTESIRQVKAFYEKWFDVEFFLKTYAVNILVGMDDDYWSNANNYYLYFGDTANNGRKVYFIPFDYDNTLGASIKGNHDEGEKEGIEQNPFDWGRGANRPLMDKLLQVPEYRELFKEKLIEVSSADSEWNYEKCSQRWYDYWSMVEPYLNSPDLSDQICTKSHWDNVYKPSGLSLVNQANNLYDYTRACFMSYLREPGEKIKFDLNGGNIDGNTAPVYIEFPDSFMSLSSLLQNPKRNNYFFAGWTKTKNGDDYQDLAAESVVYARWKTKSEIKNLYIYELEPGMADYDSSYEGIQIAILNVPKYVGDGGDAQVRQIYVNGVKVSDESWRTDVMRSKVWKFPYTETGKEYEIYVRYLKNDYWSELEKSNKITIKAESGKGKFTLNSGKINYSVSNGIMSLSEQPEIYVAGKRIGSMVNGEVYTPGFYDINFHDSGWHYNKGVQFEENTIEPFNTYLKLVERHGKDVANEGLNWDLEASLNYIVSNAEWGDYKFDISFEGKSFRSVKTAIPNELSIYELKAGDEGYDPYYEGIQIGIKNRPVYIKDGGHAQVREFYVNGVRVSDVSWQGDMMRSSIWKFPYTEAYRKYEVYVRYLREDWGTELVRSDPITITASSGIGKFSLQTSDVRYTVKNGVMSIDPQPTIYVEGKKIGVQANGSVYNPGYFLIEIHDSTWHYNAGLLRINECEIQPFDLYSFIKNNCGQEDADEGLSYILEARLFYEVYNNEWGPYKLSIKFTGDSFTIVNNE